MATTTVSVQKRLGLRLGELRRRKELTQEVLAEKVGMLTPNYARIEQGRMNVTLDTLTRLANALGVDVVELFKAPTTKKSPRPGRPKKAAG